MKRFILILLFALCGLMLNAQVVSNRVEKISNATTAFGQNLSLGTKITDTGTGITYVVISGSGVESTYTITTALSAGYIAKEGRDEQTLSTNGTPGHIEISDGNEITINVNDGDSIALDSIAVINNKIDELQNADDGFNTGVEWDDSTDELKVIDGNGTLSAIITGFVKEEDQLDLTGIRDTLDDHGIRIGDNESNITSLDVRVTQNESDIEELQSADDGFNDTVIWNESLNQLSITDGGGTLLTTINGFVEQSDVGVAGGVASLDVDGKVPYEQIPDNFLYFKDTWSATNNTPTLNDSTGTTGDVYYVNLAGTQDLGSGSQTFYVGDWVAYNGSKWTKLDGGNYMRSVNGQTGAAELYLELNGDLVNIFGNNTTIDIGNATSVVENTDDISNHIADTDNPHEVGLSELSDYNSSSVITIDSTETVTDKAQHKVLLNDGVGILMRHQTDYWNGSSWSSTNGYGFGSNALYNNTGSNSNGFGYRALRYNTGSNNTAIGHRAGYTSDTLTVSNSTMLGANAIATKDNQVVLGDNNIEEVTTAGVVVHDSYLGNGTGYSATLDDIDEKIADLGFGTGTVGTLDEVLTEGNTSTNTMTVGGIQIGTSPGYTYSASQSRNLVINDNGNTGGARVSVIGTSGLLSPGLEMVIDGSTSKRALMLLSDEGDNDYGLDFYTTNNSSVGVKMSISGDGELNLSQYGSGNITGTAAKYLAVDASGNVIEADGTSGGSTPWTSDTYGITYTDNVGIGTSSTSYYKLYVNGATYLNGSTTVASTLGVNGAIVVSNGMFMSYQSDPGTPSTGGSIWASSSDYELYYTNSVQETLILLQTKKKHQ